MNQERKGNVNLERSLTKIICKLMSYKINRNSNDYNKKKMETRKTPTTNKWWSKSVSSNRKNSIEGWYILPEVWQAIKIKYDAHIKHGFHLKFDLTNNDILRAEYKWDNMHYIETLISNDIFFLDIRVNKSRKM